MAHRLIRRQWVGATRLCAGAAFALALGGLVHSAFRDPGQPLTIDIWFLGLIPNFAVAIILLSAAIWIMKSGLNWRRRRALTLTAALGAMAIGVANLWERLSGISLGIDTLLLRPALMDQLFEFPGRMGILGAVTTVLLSLSIFLLVRSRRVVWSQTLAAVAFAICFFSFVVRLYSGDNVFGMAHRAVISGVGAVSCLMLSVATLGLRARRGPCGLLASPLPGGLLARRMVPAALSAPIVVGWFRLQGESWHLYDTVYGLALFAVANVSIFTILIFLTARALNRLEIRRAQAQGMLARSQHHYRAVIDASPQLIWTCLNSGECDFLSQRWLDYTGRTLAGQLGYGWVECIHPDDRLDIQDQWVRAVNTGAPLKAEYRLRNQAGSYRWFQALAVPFREADGTIKRWFGSSTDIEDRKWAELEIHALNICLEQRVEARTAELAETRSRLQSVLDAATQVSIIAGSPEGTIELFNAGAQAMLGYDESEMVGIRTPQAFHDPVEVEARMAELSREHGVPIGPFEAFTYQAKRGQPEVRQWTYIRKDGTRLTVQLAVTAIMGPDRKVTGFLGVAVDISERILLQSRLLEQNVSLRKATLEAEFANQSKSEFLANMSHEIRTPMNVLIGMSGLMIDTGLTAEQLDYAETIQKGARSLLAVINDVLDFSKLEAGKMEADPVDFSVESVAEEVSEFLGLSARVKGLELTCAVSAGVPDWLRGDPGRLRQVLVNLIGNAIKFTAQGNVKLGVGLMGERESVTWVRFEVSDTGEGIAPEVQTRLFQAFTQADGSTTRKHGGTGLGLAICRRLVEVMGGAVGVESEVGAGARFWFELPFEAAREPQEAGQDRFREMEAVRLLVVEEGGASREVVEQALSPHGVRSDFAGDPIQAMTMIREAARCGDPYRVAMLDSEMPVISGVELARLIQSDEKISATAVILLVAGGACERAGLAKPVKGEIHLCKPLRSHQLRKAVARALGPATPPPAVERSRSQSSTERLLLVEDNPDNQKLAVRLLGKHGYACDIASNGLEALDCLSRGTYRLVLMDCQMPEMDGFQATAAIRKRELGRRTPIIAITANALAGDREKCLKAGMDGYLAKPIVEADLVRTIERWLSPVELAGVAVPARNSDGGEPHLGS